MSKELKAYSTTIWVRALVEGLDHVDSDMASDMAQDIGDVIAVKLTEELKQRGNEFNTNGTVNVALFFRDVILPSHYSFQNNDKLVKLANKVVKGLSKEIIARGKAEWDTQKNKQSHIDSYRVLRHLLEKWIKDE